MTATFSPHILHYDEDKYCIDIRTMLRWLWQKSTETRITVPCITMHFYISSCEPGLLMSQACNYIQYVGMHGYVGLGWCMWVSLIPMGSVTGIGLLCNYSALHRLVNSHNTVM